MTSVDKGATERLAKRLADMLPCSRREAELYILGAWVSVDGELVEEAGARVGQEQVIVLSPDATLHEIPPVTLLLHKPAGTDTDAAHRLLFAANHHEPERAGLRFLPHHVKAQRASTASLRSCRNRGFAKASVSTSSPARDRSR